jgi:hypothetical protein
MGESVSQVRIVTRRKPTSPTNPPGGTKPGDKAFDTWLKQGLHKIFDEVAREPIPEDLLKLIEEHREK